MEKKKWDKTKVVVRTQEEIEDYNKCIGYRKARVKRYGKSATQRQKEKEKAEKSKI